MPFRIVVDNITVQISHIDRDGNRNPLPIVVLESEESGAVNRIAFTRAAAYILAEELKTFISEESMDEMARISQERDGLINVESVSPIDATCFPTANKGDI